MIIVRIINRRHNTKPQKQTTLTTDSAVYQMSLHPNQAAARLKDRVIVISDKQFDATD